jgi:hypothetical protein
MDTLGEEENVDANQNSSPQSPESGNKCFTPRTPRIRMVGKTPDSKVGRVRVSISTPKIDENLLSPESSFVGSSRKTFSSTPKPSGASRRKLFKEAPIIKSDAEQKPNQQKQQQQQQQQQHQQQQQDGPSKGTHKESVRGPLRRKPLFRSSGALRVSAAAPSTLEAPSLKTSRPWCLNDIVVTGQPLGRGKFGNVYKGREKATGAHVAMKVNVLYVMVLHVLLYSEWLCL